MSYNQLNLGDHYRLLVPENIKLNDLLNDTIKLIKSRRSARITQSAQQSSHKISETCAVAISQLSQLQSELDPQIQSMQTLSDNTARSVRGTELAERYNSEIADAYQSAMNCIRQALSSLLSNSSVPDSLLPKNHYTMSYRKVPQLIDSLTDYQSKIDSIIEHLPDTALNPEKHLCNQDFLNDLIAYNADYQHLKLINVNTEYIVIEEVNQDGTSEYHVDYDDLW